MVAAEVSLGSIYLREHKAVDAAQILPHAVEMQSTMAIDPAIKADGMRRLADLRAQQHQWKEAASLYEKAITLFEQRFGSSHPYIDPIRREYSAATKAAAKSHPA